MYNNFNPRSRAGSDIHVVVQFLNWVDFNPRSRAGSDAAAHDLIFLHGISIHAPAQGATWHGRLQACDLQDFNPRSRAGSDGGL